jgi:hypothetical protein
MQPLLTEGEFVHPEESLEKRVDDLEGEVSELRSELAKTRATFTAFIQNARSVFGGTVPTGQVSAPNAESVWESRIAKCGAPQGRILRVLLDGGGEMALAQIRRAARTESNTSKYLDELRAKNWVQRLGAGIWALK